MSGDRRIRRVDRRRRAPRAARELERYLGLSPVVLYALEVVGDAVRPLWVSDNITRVLGYSVEEALRPTWWLTHLHEDDRPAALAAFARLLAGTAQRHEYRFRHRDGAEHWVLDDQRLVPDPAGGPAQVVGAWTDISEIRRAEQALRESEGKFRALAEQALVGIYAIAEGRFVYLNPRGAEIFGYEPHELNGHDVFDVVLEADRPKVRDALRRRVSGEISSLKYEFCAQRRDGEVIVVGVHGTVAEIGGQRQIVGVMQDITEKRRGEDMIQEYIARLERAVLGTVNAVSHMVELRDPYTAGHERRVGLLAASMAAELGMDEHTQHGLRIAGSLHDVGKVIVPAEILTKPGSLSAPETAIVRTHAEQGYEVLKDVEFPWPVAEVARQHHERLDGSGYPRGLRGDEILFEARIVAIADVIESMASHRPYRPSVGIADALSEIEWHAGTLYDPEAAAACLRLFRVRGYHLPA